MVVQTLARHEQLADAYKAGRPIVFFLDYDGTLTPLVRNPGMALLDDVTRDQLRGLAELSEVFVNIISGRTLDDVRDLVGLSELSYIGSGGMEIEWQQNRIIDPAAERSNTNLIPIPTLLSGILKQYPRTWIERKHFSMTIHYRGLLPLAGVCFCSEVGVILRGIPDIQYRQVSEAIEVMPTNAWDKGAAVQMIVDKIRNLSTAEPFPIYYGDAANDTEGMGATLELGGLAIGVGDDAPEIATDRISDVELMYDELHMIRQSLDNDRRLLAIEDIHSLLKATPDVPGIVIVDANPRHREQLTRELRKFGWKVWSTASPDVAENFLRTHTEQIRAVLIDLELPGFQSSRKLVEWKESFPAVLGAAMADVSAYAATVFRQSSEVPLYIKPVQVNELNRNLSSELATRRGMIALPAEK